MSNPNEVVREKNSDAGHSASCCGPLCCSAESTSDSKEAVSSEKHADAATLGANGAKSYCCGSTCCA